MSIKESAIKIAISKEALLDFNVAKHVDLRFISLEDQKLFNLLSKVLHHDYYNNDVYGQPLTGLIDDFAKGDISKISAMRNIGKKGQEQVAAFCQAYFDNLKYNKPILLNSQ